MGRGITALIRLHAWRCEERRRAVAAARLRLEALGERRRDLAETIAAERNVRRILTDQAAAVSFAAYEQRNRAASATLAAELAAAEESLVAARADLAAAYREKRKLELAEAHSRRAEASAQARREQLITDELALQRYAPNVGEDR
jgi:flagellar FliJ protein